MMLHPSKLKRKVDHLWWKKINIDFDTPFVLKKKKANMLIVRVLIYNWKNKREMKKKRERQKVLEVVLVDCELHIISCV